jgi:hypothetical protein
MKEFISLSFICEKYYTWVYTLMNRLDGTVKISVCEKVSYNLEVLKKKYLHTLRLVSSQCSRSWLTEKKIQLILNL